ncbi:DUF2861 family protein [Vibrio sp. TH_r3]|uniref:DUF2861 family protein n=1 Tax=Vibrio sp. TH_r3 TaxID=3082084 RepID=UPI002954BAD1|nr:DUF2861 family protein [Vibrio sp. TH_r3]MDV7103511.1 DUF2861 family protein [Vibrio sp. TH_r3]
MRLYLLLFTFCFNTSIAANEWFESSSPLNQAHQKLLNNDLEGSFRDLINVWQADPDDYVKQHLNELLLKSLESDCGKSISNEPVAAWIHSVVIKRQSIQSPGRSVARAIVEITSPEEITSVKMLNWPDGSVSNESNFVVQQENERNTYTVTYDLTQRLANGLYRIEVTAQNNDSWSVWVVMSESISKQVVRWDSKDTWAVDKIGLLNPYCVLPVLTVSLYDYVADEYVRVWHREYESNYPKQLPISELNADRYVLAVGITHHRWQGPVIIEDQQIISKTYDISAD